MKKISKICIPSSCFSTGRLGGLPEEWNVKSPRQSLLPEFKLVKKGNRKVLRASGNGRADCVGQIFTKVSVKAGQTYRMQTRFQMPKTLNPHRNLLFCVYTKDFNNGIFRFNDLGSGNLVGENRFFIPGNNEIIEGEVSIFFRASAKGKVWIEEISLEECGLIAPRPITVACVKGRGDPNEWSQVMDSAGKTGADLVLLPESINGKKTESLSGPSAQIMQTKARQYRMYVAGGIYFYNQETDQIFNSVLFFDRNGESIGRYDKVHPFTPEILEDGVTAGTGVPVFETDFGTVGIMTCYDSWFTDVAELLALKGSEIILLPNEGYYRSLMPARAADNNVRLVVSTLDHHYGVWDTAGRDVLAPDLDPTCNAKNEKTFSNIIEKKVGKLGLLLATLDLSQSPSPHNWGGPMRSAPGGRRNRREQSSFLYSQIQEEVENWEG